MRNSYCYLLVIHAFLFLGCTERQADKSLKSVKLIKTGEKIFFIDSLTVSRSSMIQVVDWGGKKSLSLLNAPTNSINIYEYETGVQKAKIQFQREGDIGVGKLKAYHIVNESLIYLYNGSKLYETDSSKSIKNSYNVGSKYTGNHANISINTFSPMIVDGNSIYFNTILLGEMKHKPLIKFDTKTKRFESLYRLSDKFENGFWGAIHYDIYDFTYNPVKKL